MTCRAPDCNNEKFDNSNKCTLHCSNDDINDRNRDAHKSKFYVDFHDYIFYKLEKSNSHKEYDSQEETAISENILFDAKKFDWTNVDETVYYKNRDFFELLKDESITFVDINFPDYVIHYLNGNISILEKIGKVVFEKCRFRNFWESGSVNLFYEDCVFYNYLNIKVYEEYFNAEEDIKVKHSNKKEYICKSCRFEGNVYIEGQGTSYTDTSYIPCKVFLDCQFMGNIELNNVKVGSVFISVSKVFKDVKRIENKEHHRELLIKYKNIYKFKDITLRDSEFDDSFKINGLDVDYLKDNRDKYEDSISDLIYEFEDISEINKISIKDTNFRKKFELKNVNVDNLNFSNSNVDGIFDVYKSSFIKAKFHKSIFKEFAAFEYVVFGDGKKENITDFIYTTFKDFSNFRNTIFKSGLNFSSANIKQEPNFLNTDISLVGTDRETLRIIKNSFEKVNNKIESNRFFIYEMNSYKQESEDCIVDGLSKFIVSKNSFFAIFLMCTMIFAYFGFGLIVIPILLLVIIFRIVFTSSLGLLFTYIILMANQCISGFGKSYIRPIVIFFISIVFYTYILQVHKNIFNEDLITGYAVLLRNFVTQDWFISLSKFLNACAANVPLFSKALENKDGIQFISLLFFIWFGILTWQIIVAVKRNTQH